MFTPADLTAVWAGLTVLDTDMKDDQPGKRLHARSAKGVMHEKSRPGAGSSGNIGRSPYPVIMGKTACFTCFSGASGAAPCNAVDG